MSTLTTNIYQYCLELPIRSYQVLAHLVNVSPTCSSRFKPSMFQDYSATSFISNKRSQLVEGLLSMGLSLVFGGPPPPKKKYYNSLFFFLNSWTNFCGNGGTIGIRRESRCLPYAGFLPYIHISQSIILIVQGCQLSVHSDPENLRPSLLGIDMEPKILNLGG